VQRQRSDAEAGHDHPPDLLQAGGDADDAGVQAGLCAQQGHGPQRVRGNVRLEGHRRLAAQVVEGQALPPEQPVLRPTEEAEELPVHHLVAQPRIGLADETERERGLLLQHRLHRRLAGGNRQGVAGAGMAAVELGQRLVEEGRNDVGGERDRDLPRDLLRHVAQQHRQARDGAVEVDALFVEQRAHRGDAEDVRPPVDQPVPEALLHAPQGVADARLLQPQPRGGQGDAALFDDDHEGPQQVPVQVVGEAPLPTVVHSLLLFIAFSLSICRMTGSRTRISATAFANRENQS